MVARRVLGLLFWEAPQHPSIHHGKEEPGTAVGLSWLWVLASDLGKFLILSELWFLYLERPLQGLVRQLNEVLKVFVPGQTSMVCSSSSLSSSPLSHLNRNLSRAVMD